MSGSLLSVHLLTRKGVERGGEQLHRLLVGKGRHRENGEGGG